MGRWIFAGLALVAVAIVVVALVISHHHGAGHCQGYCFGN